jgi:hypothetical protein
MITNKTSSYLVIPSNDKKDNGNPVNTSIAVPVRLNSIIRLI